MGRLLNPGVGELADRMTILELKCTRAPAAQTTEHFRAELAQVHMRLDRTAITEPLRQRIATLRTVNERLWELEDQMAAWAARTFEWVELLKAPDIAQVGIEIWRANRLRNTLIAEINQLAGTDAGPEKL